MARRNVAALFWAGMAAASAPLAGLALYVDSHVDHAAVAARFDVCPFALAALGMAACTAAGLLLCHMERRRKPVVRWNRSSRPLYQRIHMARTNDDVRAFRSLINR